MCLLQNTLTCDWALGADSITDASEEFYPRTPNAFTPLLVPMMRRGTLAHLRLLRACSRHGVYLGGVILIIVRQCIEGVLV